MLYTLIIKRPCDGCEFGDLNRNKAREQERRNLKERRLKPTNLKGGG